MLKKHKYAVMMMFLAILGVFFALVSVQARSKDYVLELTVYTDRSESYVLYVDLDDRELTRLRNDSANEIKLYLVRARREYADEIGYRSEIYGEENYKMVVIKRYIFIVKEKSSGRILLSK
ncbi:MAG: hypothetical protein EOM80_18700 [Erysipelotrichia bacterium]|nr:hypothetical protein [Candidatus Riflebacteria bacterium]NCB40792.1 hypothetical protein [Erysipelotrichia bacterium]